MTSLFRANVQTPRWVAQYTQSRSRSAIGIIVVLLSAALTSFVSEQQLILLIGLLLGVGIVFLILRWPPMGLALLIIASLVVPLQIGTGTGTSINITVLLLVLLLGLWLLDTLRRGGTRLVISQAILPLLAFAMVAILSFVVGQLPWFAFAQPAPLRAQLGGLAIFLLSAGAFLLMAHWVKDLRWLERLTWLFLAMGALYFLGRLMPGMEPIAGRLFQHGSLGSLFWIWLVALAFSQAVFNKRLHPILRLGLVGFVLAIFYVGLLQGRSWASGWLPPLIAVIAALFVASPRVGLLVMLVGGAMIALNASKIVDLIMINEEYSWITRLEAWRILAEMVKTNPVLGLGPANYYWYTPLYPILGWYVRFSSHNQYVDIVAQIGLLGLACFFWFIWKLGRMGWDLRHRAPKGFVQAYVFGAFGGLVGTLAAGMLADWFLPFVYNIGLGGFRASVFGWLFLGGLLAIGRSTDDALTEIDTSKT